MKRDLRLSIKANKELIEALKTKANISSTQELLNNSLSLLSWAIKEKSKGRIVGSINNKKDEISYT
ncbi:MAG: hypothetical protein GY804_03550, partial [Alphaproteobacteria bacterium]|nr:hypothetical protein [Alphaproteobacteria bacterium]